MSRYLFSSNYAVSLGGWRFLNLLRLLNCQSFPCVNISSLGSGILGFWSPSDGSWFRFPTNNEKDRNKMLTPYIEQQQGSRDHHRGIRCPTHTPTFATFASPSQGFTCQGEFIRHQLYNTLNTKNPSHHNSKILVGLNFCYPKISSASSPSYLSWVSRKSLISSPSSAFSALRFLY